MIRARRKRHVVKRALISTERLLKLESTSEEYQTFLIEVLFLSWILIERKTRCELHCKSLINRIARLYLEKRMWETAIYFPAATQGHLIALAILRFYGHSVDYAVERLRKQRPHYDDFHHRASERELSSWLLGDLERVSEIRREDFDFLPALASCWSLRDVYSVCHIILYKAHSGPSPRRAEDFARILDLANKRAAELKCLDAELEVALCRVMVGMQISENIEEIDRVLALPSSVAGEELGYYHPKLIAATLVSLEKN